MSERSVIQFDCQCCGIQVFRFPAEYPVAVPNLCIGCMYIADIRAMKPDLTDDQEAQLRKLLNCEKEKPADDNA